MLIEDGKGSGGNWHIRNQRGQVDADIHTTLEEHSEKGDAYSWSNVSYNYDAADTIIGLRNTSATKDLYIDRIYISGSTATVVTIHRVDSSAALAGTAIAAVNLNGNSNQIAEAEAKGDETTNSSQGNILLNAEIEAAKLRELDFQSAIILAPGDMLGIDFVTDGTTANATIFGFFNKHIR